MSKYATERDIPDGSIDDYLDQGKPMPAPQSSADFHQQRGMAWDIIDEALEAYRQFMLDDDFDYQRALFSIMERMQARRIPPSIATDDPTCPHGQPLHQDCFKCEEAAAHLGLERENLAHLGLELGLATTGELLDELRARIEMHALGGLARRAPAEKNDV
jgi:hypothetical protein